jgi:hypothetical protein
MRNVWGLRTLGINHAETNDYQGTPEHNAQARRTLHEVDDSEYAGGNGLVDRLGN